MGGEEMVGCRWAGSPFRWLSVLQAYEGRKAPGDLVDAIVPFMGESITDGTLATFMKSSLVTGVEVDEPVAQIETDKFVAKEGDTVTPGTKVSVVSKSSPSGTHVVPSDDKVVKDSQPRSPPARAPQPTPPTAKIDKLIA
ncbi:hypothetical protein C4D60_Mb06t16990 [Musa balbisiana]|uniref:Lipoyl-binding domain-containing protein n=1 Tax=Musa balbisiana TaxID=52838 RepID=A0A4S8IPW4_MUSBA|nr:hypothetical protein C4D60_Mb06t16990 [Musa balbisiana]